MPDVIIVLWFYINKLLTKKSKNYEKVIINHRITLYEYLRI